MRRVLISAALVAAISVGTLQTSAAEQPKLIVMVVLDQFRPDYLTSFAPHWRRGFKTLLAEGANFRRAQYPYLHTDTCAGHFTISTGTLPRTHGMVTDDWYDRAARKQVECTVDEASPAITYGVESKAGNSAKNLRVSTFPDRLREQRPGARVVALSMKARGAIGLAGQKGDAVTWFDDVADTFVTSTAFATTPVPAVKQFFDRFPYQRDIDAVWTLRDPVATYRNRDAGIGERPPAGWNGLFPHAVKGIKGADEQYATQWQRSPFADAYLSRLALTLLDTFRLGQRDTTDYLGISFSGPDRVGHAFGPDSREVEDIAARMDDVLGDLIEQLDAKVGRTNYVLALSADHGVASVPLATAGVGRVASDDVRERIEEVLVSRYGVPPQGGTHVEWSINGFWLQATTKTRLANDSATLRAVQAAAEDIPGVQRLLYGPALSVDSRDPVVRMAALSYDPQRRGEFIIFQERNWVRSGRTPANAGDHSGGYDYDSRVPLLILGAGIRPGTYDAASAPTDIAPTLAAITGVSLPRAEGRVLAEALLPATSTAQR